MLNAEQGVAELSGEQSQYSELPDDQKEKFSDLKSYIAKEAKTLVPGSQIDLRSDGYLKEKGVGIMEIIADNKVLVQYLTKTEGKLVRVEIDLDEIRGEESQSGRDQDFKPFSREDLVKDLKGLGLTIYSDDD